MIIDVSAAYIWDISSVQSLEMAVLKFRRHGAEVEIVDMNAASEAIVDKLAIHDKPGAADKLLAHQAGMDMTPGFWPLLMGPAMPPLSAMRRRGSPSIWAVGRITRSPVCKGLRVALVYCGTDTPATRHHMTDAQARLIAAGVQGTITDETGEPDVAQLAQQAVCDSSRVV